MSNTATAALSSLTDPVLTNNSSTWVTTVSDATPPTFTLPTLAAGYCPADIIQAVFSGLPYPNDLTYLRPDYFLFGAGFTMLNLTNLADNCTLAANPISWTIDFGNNGSVELSGIGQLNLYGTPIEFPVGDNKITFTVSDSSLTAPVGNPAIKSVILTVIPRPVMTLSP
jgi:hypothetical protein